MKKIKYFYRGFEIVEYYKDRMPHYICEGAEFSNPYHLDAFIDELEERNEGGIIH